MATSSPPTIYPPQISKKSSKRRRLNASPAHDRQLESILGDTLVVSRPFLTDVASGTTPQTPPVCTSCHHALTAKPGSAISCARCGSTTCAICSRRCTVAAPSLPPTPRLTFSPTPSPTRSPMRLALTLNTANTNGNQLSAIGKRKKPRDEDDEEGSAIARDKDGAGMEDERPGCGRTFCRNCCFENLQDNFLTTCFDCYGIH